MLDRDFVFHVIHLTLAQSDLLGSTRTGASSLDSVATIPRITFSIRVKTSRLENEKQMCQQAEPQ